MIPGLAGMAAQVAAAAPAASMGPRCGSAAGWNSIHGPAMLFAQHLWAMDAVRRRQATASMGHRCGQPSLTGREAQSRAGTPKPQAHQSPGAGARTPSPEQRRASPPAQAAPHDTERERHRAGLLGERIG